MVYFIFIKQDQKIVSFNNEVCSSEPIKFGVPQGSILGPLVLFINDLTLVLENIYTATDLYADDTTVYDVQTNVQTLERNLESYINEAEKMAW